MRADKPRASLVGPCASSALMRMAVFGAVLVGLVACDGVRGSPPADADVGSIERARRIDQIQAARDIGDYDGVQQALADARADGIDDPRLAFYEAELLLQTGQDADTKAALPLLAEAVAGAPTWIEPRLIMADAYLRLQRPAAARSVYEEFDRLFPEHPAGPYGQGAIAAMQGHNDEAKELLAEAISRDPNYAPAFASLASVARLTGDAAAEQQALERYVALRPHAPQAWESLGDRYLSAGRREDARRAFERSYGLAPRPEIALRLADIARSSGDQAAADLWSARAKP